MRWIRSKITNWLIKGARDCDSPVPLQAHGVHALHTAGSYMLRVIMADNGCILSLVEDCNDFIHTRAPRTLTRICPDGGDVMAEIAAIIAAYKLQR